MLFRGGTVLLALGFPGAARGCMVTNFIRQSFRDGTETLFAPAPQSFFDTEDSGDRLFERRLDRVSRSDTEAMLEREIRFDPDLWVLALETEDVADLVALSDGEPPPQSAADSLFRR